MRAILALTLLVVGGLAEPLAAQRRPLPVGPGQRVRVWAPPATERREGVVIEIDSDAMVIALLAGPTAEGQPIEVSRQVDTIRVAAIQQLYVYRELDANARVRGAVGWGIAGAIAGGVTGGALGFNLGTGVDEEGSRTLIGGILGAAAGGLVGAIGGGYIRSRWERVLPPRRPPP